MTPDTLDAYIDFVRHPDPEALRERLADGRLTYEHLCQMHSERGLEAAWGNGPGPVLVPHVRLDLDTAGLDAFAAHLARTASDKRIILNADLAPLDAAPWLAAGWTLDTHAVMATTDLTARRWPLDPRVQARPISDLLAPDLLSLYADLTTVGPIGDTGETDPASAFEEDLQDEEKRLFTLLDGGQVVAAAVLTPDARGAAIHMLGVRPGRRGEGLGLALHAHLLAVAAETHRQHSGGTDFANQAMRRIFGRNGAVLIEQKQWVRHPA